VPAPLTRRAATFVWASMLVVPFAFMAIVFQATVPELPELTAPLFWAAIAVSALNVTLSRLLPPRLAGASSDPAALAFTRLLVAWALCEAAALAPLVAFILTRDPRLLGVLGVDLLALVLLYPTDARWESVTPVPPPLGGSRRMVR
jgi:hypothetical protein